MNKSLNSKSYELVPGVWVTDADDIEYNKHKRLDTSKFKSLQKKFHANGYSDQEVRDKIGRNNSWLVCSSWSDPKNKKMYFKVLVNADTTEIHEVGYEDICKDYHWTSFKWSADGMMIIPKM